VRREWPGEGTCELGQGRAPARLGRGEIGQDGRRRALRLRDLPGAALASSWPGRGLVISARGERGKLCQVRVWASSGTCKRRRARACAAMVGDWGRQVRDDKWVPLA
jgi:hypothetical protein